MLGNKTGAWLNMFAGSTVEQHAFRQCIPESQKAHRHYLTNFVVHRFFYHPAFSYRIQYAYSAEQVLDALTHFQSTGQGYFTNAYQRLIPPERLERDIRRIFDKVGTFWEQHHRHAGSDDFPVKELLSMLALDLQGFDFGQLSRGLLIQDLSTAGVITNVALMNAMNKGLDQGANKATFALLGKGGQEGLDLIMPAAQQQHQTPNQRLVALYQKHRHHLGIQPQEARWDNVTTIEHMCCKFYRLVSHCTTHPERRPEFWKIVGRHDLAGEA